MCECKAIIDIAPGVLTSMCGRPPPARAVAGALPVMHDTVQAQVAGRTAACPRRGSRGLSDGGWIVGRGLSVYMLCVTPSKTATHFGSASFTLKTWASTPR